MLLAGPVMALMSMPAAAQDKLPRADVIDVPAMGEGLRVSNVFQCHMVLQRDKPWAVWGWAEAGAEVSVAFGGVEKKAVAAADRSWKVGFEPLAASAEPATMTVKSGAATVTLEDILVGDVWVLGGQSNMEFELAKVENGQLEIASAHFPEIRVLTVPQGEGPVPLRDFPRLMEWSDWSKRHFRKGYWEPCTPAVARELSAIGYVFARRVHKASGVPIGVIDTSRGGTTVETWTPQEVLRGMDSEVVATKLAEWDKKVAEWNPQADLDARIERHRQQVEKLSKEGRPVPADMVEPADLRPGPLADPNHPGGCYAGMIEPLAGLAVKGALFHQGYNNAFEGTFGVNLYRAVFPEMIRSWRKAFADPQLPFGILSLCTEGNPQTEADYVEKMYNTGIHIRAVHYETFLDFLKAGDTNIGYASTYDLRRRWYHPQVKLPAGERIARWALATQYGFSREIQWKPPLLVSMQAADGALVLEFDAPVADPEDGAMLGFAICGSDRRFQPATAVHVQERTDERGRPVFNTKKVRLSSPLVAEPVHFRYAWGRNPLANVQLAGNSDIPLGTQRSDDWTMEEVPLGVLDGEAAKLNPRQQQAHILRVLRLEDTRRKLAEAEAYLEAHRKAYEEEMKKLAP